MFKKLAFVFVPLIAITVAIFFYFSKQVQEQKVINIMDQLRLTLDAQLKEHKMNDLKNAILISKNQAIIDALENDDEDLGYKLLSDTVNEISKRTHYRIRAQIITYELNIFARSWDDIYTGMPLGDYRTDLKYFETHKTPRTSLEIGRRLGIKATVPIFLKDGELLGFVEVISFFKGLTDFFSSLGVDLYVLLDVSHMDTAVLMTDNLVLKNYVVANIDYNYSHLQTLQSIDYKELRLSGVLYKDSKYIFYENMRDGNGKIIGAFVFVLPQKYLDYFRDPEDDISFLVNMTRSSLYEITKEQTYRNGFYKDYSAESMLYLQNIIEREDMELFLDEAYEKLDTYSKDELIQMMLRKSVVKKIDGEIQ